MGLCVFMFQIQILSKDQGLRSPGPEDGSIYICHVTPQGTTVFFR